MKTIAITGGAFLWGGGIHLLRNIIRGLYSVEKKYGIRIVLLLPQKKRRKLQWLRNYLRPVRRVFEAVMRGEMPSAAILKTVGSSEASLEEVYRDYCMLIGEQNIIFYADTSEGLRQCLEEIDAQLVMPIIVGSSLNCFGGTPYIGYIYDFQHRYYPNFFSEQEITSRERIFSEMIQQTKTIIVNSKSVENDIHAFYPGHCARVFTLPFAPIAEMEWLDLLGMDRTDLDSKYRLPKKYFLISNQFWLHKSHITAFEAYAKLKEEGKISDIDIVCTGKISDHRAPGYFVDLYKKIEVLGIKKHIHFLGYVPKSDQIRIMDHSVAVLQPTLFEGGPGGGAVYDAVSIGVRSVVSDIPPNMDVLSEDVLFFKAGSVDDMSEKMVNVLKMETKRSTREQLLIKAKQYSQHLGEVLMLAVDDAIARQSK